MKKSVCLNTKYEIWFLIENYDIPHVFLLCHISYNSLNSAYIYRCVLQVHYKYFLCVYKLYEQLHNFFRILYHVLFARAL